MSTTPTTFAFGSALKTLRESKGLTVQQATLMGGWASTTTILGWEKGNRYPSLHNLYRLARVYGVKPEAILARAEKTSANLNPMEVRP